MDIGHHAFSISETCHAIQKHVVLIKAWDCESKIFVQQSARYFWHPTNAAEKLEIPFLSLIVYSRLQPVVLYWIIPLFDLTVLLLFLWPKI